MRRFIFTLALAGMMQTAAQAQIKLPVFDPDLPESKGGSKGVAFSPATERADFRHGTLLNITLRDGTTVRGTLVRADAAKKTLYVRTQPNAAPVAIAEGNIGSVQKGFLKGNAPVEGIAPAAANAAPPLIENIVEPEIIKTVVFNGLHKSVRYQANTVSPGERDILQQMEDAENALADLENHQDLQQTLVSNQVAMQNAILQGQRFLNQSVQMDNANRYPAYTSTFYNRRNRLEGGMSANQELLVQRMIGVNTPAVAVDTKMMQTDGEALSKARQRVQSILNRGIYEDGRLIAVRMEN